VTELLLEGRGIYKRYGHIRALSNANFGVRAGEVVALVGDNGAGKSTLVKCLSGAMQPDAGEILIEGQATKLDSPLHARQLGVETVYQDLALAPDLTAAQNLFLGREIIRSGILGLCGVVDRPSMRAKADTALRNLGVGVQDSSVAVGSLSGGQRQGVAIARLVTWATKVVFMDEPTAALGVTQRERVHGAIRGLRDRGLGVVLISHNLPEVLAVADRLDVMRLGQRVAQFEANNVALEQVVAAMTGAMEQQFDDAPGVGGKASGSGALN